MLRRKSSLLMRREGLVYPGAVRKQGFARALCIWISALCAFPHSPRSNHPLFNPLAQERGLRFGIPVRLMGRGDILLPIFCGHPGTICSELRQGGLKHRPRPMGTIMPQLGTFYCQAAEQGAELPFQPGVSFFPHSVVSISNNNS